MLRKLHTVYGIKCHVNYLRRGLNWMPRGLKVSHLLTVDMITFVKRQFLVLDLNGVLVQCLKARRSPSLHPRTWTMAGFQHTAVSIKFAQSKLWVTIWSFMKSTHTQVVVELIFKGIKPPCMVLGQELCMTLLTPEGRLLGSREPCCQPIFESVETHIMGLTPHYDRVSL